MKTPDRMNESFSRTFYFIFIPPSCATIIRVYFENEKQKGGIFENEIKEIEINEDTGFKKLILVSATINKIQNASILPSVEFILSNENSRFTSYSSLVPSTNNFNCFDLLKVANYNLVLSNEIFYTLKCILPDNLGGGDVIIEMEFEIE